MDVAIRENPLEVDAAIINVWMLVTSEELEKIFEERKQELFAKYCVFTRSNGQSACILKKLILMDDSMIELSLSRGLLDSLALELRSPSILPLVTIGILEALMISRSIYLDAVLSHTTLWKAIKKTIIKNRFSNTAPWLSNAVFKSCLVATLKQINFMVTEEVLPGAISIVSNSGDRSAKRFMESVDYGIEKIVKIYKKTKNERCIDCLNMLKVIAG